MAQGFLHPNCRHGITTYYPELEDNAEDTAETLQMSAEDTAEQEATQQALNYATRNVKKYERLEKGSLAPTNINNYKNKKTKWETIKQNVVDTMYEIRTNEHPPLKLYEFPKKHYSIIKDTIDNAPSTMKNLLIANIDKFKFKNIKSRKTARYSSLFDDIKLNLNKDSNNNYRTLFHEMSHKLDHLLGNVSQDGAFEKLLIDDFEKIKKNYMVKYKLSESETYTRIGNILKKDRKANSISDIIGGITKNKCVGGSKHSDEYWEIEGKLGKEAFAHFGSASIRKDKEELLYIKQMFPNAYNHFKDSLIGKGGNV